MPFNLACHPKLQLDVGYFHIYLTFIKMQKFFLSKTYKQFIRSVVTTLSEKNCINFVSFEVKFIYF